ncbi:DNA polymerase III subunit psi [Mangrovibacter yixingensis]|uniref:DNA polymerase III subunit psi n=1 Tax=Mangrovibacter yixingensis TaxID=1529639 RepID=UPI001CFD8C57|nr:DNA polymerase III subunit psi [Mangrovibacter yixingensis]
MTSRRDWQLQQLGITQWVLRRPGVLQGEVAITVPSAVRLLIVARPLPELHNPFIQDVLRGLQLSAEQVMLLSPEKVDMLPSGSCCHIWWLGAPCPAAQPGVNLSSPGLDELYQDHQARRALWKQICQHEHDLFPDAN